MAGGGIEGADADDQAAVGLGEAEHGADAVAAEAGLLVLAGGLQYVFVVGEAAGVEVADECAAEFDGVAGLVP